MSVIQNGFLVINDMMLQRNKPDFRVDENYEAHVLKLFFHFAEYAQAKNLSILLTGKSAKNPSIKQALMLSSLKTRCNLFVSEWESSSVNAALIELNCVEVLMAAELGFCDAKICITDVVPKNKNDYEKIILLNGRPEVMYKTSKGWSSLYIPSSIQKVDGELGGAVEITNAKTKPKILSAIYDDSDMIKDDVDLSNITLDFGFIDKIKTLNQRHKEIDIADIDTAVSPLQQVINGMDRTYATEQVQLLLNDALLSKERKESNDRSLICQ
jgi:hypothetical protein